MKSSWHRILLTIPLAAASICCASRASAQTSTAISALSPALVALAPAGSAVPDLKVGVLNLIPDDALGFVVATDLMETKKEVEAVLKKLKVPFDDENYQEFSKFLEGIEGWDPKSAHALVVVPDDDDGEGFVLVPVTDYKKFAASLGADPTVVGPTKYEIEDGPKGFMAEKANYAIVGGPDDVELIQRVLDSKKSIASSSEPIKSWLGKYKTAGVVTPAGVQKVIGTAIDGLKSIREAFPQDNPQTASIKQAFDIYDKLFVALREEATHIAIGGSLTEKVGLDFGLQFVFKPEGKLASLSKDITPLPPEAFAGLPDETFIFTGAGVFPQASADVFSSFTLGLLKTLPQDKGLDPELSKKLADAMQGMMKNVKRVSMSVDFSGATLFSGIAAIYKVEDSEKFLKQNAASVELMQELTKKDKNIPMQTLERKTIDGLDVVVLTSDLAAVLEQMEKGPGGAAGKQMFQAMFGAEGKMQAFFTAVDKETVVLAYDVESLKSLIAASKAGKRGLADDVEIKKTAALLLPSPHAIGFMDVGGYIDLAKKMASAFMAGNGVPGGALPFAIPPFPASPPIGVAGRLAPQAVEMQLVIPMQLMENTRDYVQQINTLIGGIGK
ncbi:MAG: hypothetical protein K8U03_08360 [Planctomycetia bacterium]|nr:hypothetical protein [Planctomycetia bacterium]